MSIQGSINQMIASVGAAGFALRQKKAAESLRQHQMEMLKVRTAAIEKIERRKASIERKKIKEKELNLSPEKQLMEQGINLKNPAILEQLKKQGVL